MNTVAEYFNFFHSGNGIEMIGAIHPFPHTAAVGACKNPGFNAYL